MSLREPRKKKKEEGGGALGRLEAQPARKGRTKDQ